MTDSKVLRPFVERVEGARFPRPARALGCFAVERALRLADRPLEERPVEWLLVAVAERDLEAFDDARPLARRFDPRLVEEDLEELDDVPRRRDD